MPIAYCFLKSKRQAVYAEVYRILRQNILRIRPEIPIATANMMMDFELAERNAFSEVFPEIQVRGCTFHYGQAIIRKIGQIGLKEQYGDAESMLRAWIRYILALPMLPSFVIVDVWNGFLCDPRNLTNHQGIPYPAPSAADWDKMMIFAQYFVKTWLSRTADWNHFTNDTRRTNNIPEAFHSKVKRMFGHAHSSLHHFLHFLQQLQYEYFCRQIKLEMGHPPKPKKELYQVLHRDIMFYRNIFDQRFNNLLRQFYMQPLVYRYYFLLEVRQYLSVVSYRMCLKKKY